MNANNCNTKNGYGRHYNGFFKAPASLDKIFNELLSDSGVQFGIGKFPCVNIHEDEARLVLEFVAPGFEKEEIKIKLEENKLTVSGEKKADENAEKKTYTRREFKADTFSRTFSLPENINAEEIKAEFKNGILFIEMPKMKEEKQGSREINIQ